MSSKGLLTVTSKNGGENKSSGALADATGEADKRYSPDGT